MKAFLKHLICTSVWIIAVSGLSAQEQIARKNKTPGWISNKGFWQIESNIHSPDTCIVYFYNTENVLVYREHLKGIKLDLRKARVKMRLKKALETRLKVWNNNPVLQHDQQVVSLLFNK
jgi:hypothetical protein